MTDNAQRIDVKLPNWFPSDLTCESGELLEWTKEQGLLRALRVNAKELNSQSINDVRKLIGQRNK